MNEERMVGLDGIIESLKKLTEELTELEETLAMMAGAEGRKARVPDELG